MCTHDDMSVHVTRHAQAFIKLHGRCSMSTRAVLKFNRCSGSPCRSRCRWQVHHSCCKWLMQSAQLLTFRVLSHCSTLFKRSACYIVCHSSQQVLYSSVAVVHWHGGRFIIRTDFITRGTNCWLNLRTSWHESVVIPRHIWRRRASYMVCHSNPASAVLFNRCSGSPRRSKHRPATCIQCMLYNRKCWVNRSTQSAHMMTRECHSLDMFKSPSCYMVCRSSQLVLYSSIAVVGCLVGRSIIHITPMHLYNHKYGHTVTTLITKSQQAKKGKLIFLNQTFFSEIDRWSKWK